MSQPHHTLQAEHGGRRFRIVRDAAAGFYLYVYDGARCTHDYLQDTLDDVREFAREEFGVPVQSWSHEHTTYKPCVAANQAIASRLQSKCPVGGDAELDSLAAMLAPVKSRILGIACFLALVVAVGVWLFGPDRVNVGRFKMESGVEIHLFIEADWEQGDLLYYTIHKDGREVVRKTYLSNVDRKDRFRTYTAASTDGSVVGLWVDSADVFIIYHVPSGESWPRLRDNEVSDTPEVRQKWRSRVSLLRESSPFVPVPSDFK